MKKIFIAIAALTALTFASCGNTTGQNGENDSIQIDSITIEEVGVVEAEEQAEAIVAQLTAQIKANNSEGLAQKIEEAKQYIQTLIDEDKLEAADVYKERIKTFIEENKEKIANLPSSADEIINSFAEVLNIDKSTIEDIKAAAEEKLNNASEEAKDKAKSAVKDAASQAAEEIKSKAYEAGKKAGEDVKKHLGL